MNTADFHEGVTRVYVMSKNYLSVKKMKIIITEDYREVRLMFSSSVLVIPFYPNHEIAFELNGVPCTAYSEMDRNGHFKLRVTDITETKELRSWVTVENGRLNACTIAKGIEFMQYAGLLEGIDETLVPEEGQVNEFPLFQQAGH